jgi:membrane protein
MKAKTKRELKNLIYRFRHDDVMALASMLSYSLLLSFFPFMVFLITLSGYGKLKNEDVLSVMAEILPSSAFSLVRTTINEITASRNIHLLSISLIFTVFAASGGFNAVIKGLNMAYGEKENRSFIKVQLTAISCTVGITIIIIITVVMLLLGQTISFLLAVKMNYSFIYIFLWNVLRYLLIFFSLIVVFALLYKLTPSRKLTFKEVAPGTLFATFGWITASLIFAYYVNNFANYSKVYGSIGAVMILMSWLFITSVIIIFGGEINALAAFGIKEKECEIKVRK